MFIEFRAAFQIGISIGLGDDRDFLEDSKRDRSVSRFVTRFGLRASVFLFYAKSYQNHAF
ncbi:hypothetical protein CKA32_003581 [Geitlerinema sp. FC II]|nr:hypothetical protein CKA32_003581 [Geitlerinema sp. FC II]